MFEIKLPPGGARGRSRISLGHLLSTIHTIYYILPSFQECVKIGPLGFGGGGWGINACSAFPISSKQKIIKPDIEFVLDPFTKLVAAESAGEHEGNVSQFASLHVTVLLQELQPLVKVSRAKETNQTLPGSLLSRALYKYQCSNYIAVFPL